MATLKKVAVLGGDLRSCVCAELFCDYGTECAIYGLEKTSFQSSATKCTSVYDAIYQSNAIILPLPVMSDKNFINAPMASEKISLDSIIKSLALCNDPAKEPPIILAGNPDKAFYSSFDGACLKNEIINYAEREDFCIMNAIATAEGALAQAIGATGKTLFGSSVLVCGYGRIGKLLSRYLSNLGARVFASARKSGDLEWITANGAVALKTAELAHCDIKFDLIFNTVPSLVFDKAVLCHLKGSPCYIELASRPYGIDFEEARRQGIRVISAQALPGKTAPLSAGNSIFTCIRRILDERGFII